MVYHNKIRTALLSACAGNVSDSAGHGESAMLVGRTQTTQHASIRPAGESNALVERRQTTPLSTPCTHYRRLIDESHYYHGANVLLLLVGVKHGVGTVERPQHGVQQQLVLGQSLPRLADQIDQLQPVTLLLPLAPLCIPSTPQRYQLSNRHGREKGMPSGTVSLKTVKVTIFLGNHTK